MIMADDNALADSFAVFHDRLRRKFGDTTYNCWMADLAVEEISDDAATLSTGSPVRVDRLNHQYRQDIHRIWNVCFPPLKTLTICARARLSANAASAQTKFFQPNTTSPTTAERAQASNLSVIEGGRIGSRIDVLYRLDGFAVDATNEIAFRAARKILDDGAKGQLIYIHGDSGCGKTHLLNAIANELLERAADFPVAFYSHADFRNESASAARSGRLQQFHERLASRDVVMIDDLHRLKSSVRTQEEILNLIDDFRSAGKCVLIAGLYDPARLRAEGLNARLTDRLAGGIPVMIEPASEPLKLEILAAQSAVRDAECILGDDVLSFVATSFRRSVREAIGALNHLCLVHGRDAREISITDARKALAQKLASAGGAVGLDDLLRATAEVCGLTIDDLTGRAQPQRIARARHAFSMVGRETLKESFPRLGSALKRDHTTVMSSYDRAQALHERCEIFRNVVAGIRERLGY